MNNKHRELIEEKVVNSQCNPGDVVTGWVIQSDKVREILQATIDTVLDGERERVDKIIKQHTSWKPAAGYGSEEEKGFQKGLIAEAKLIEKALTPLNKEE